MQANETISIPQPIAVPPAITPDSLLNPRAEPFRIGSSVFGQIVTLGKRFQFFSDRPDLAEIDGLVFDDLEALRHALRTAAAPS